MHPRTVGIIVGALLLAGLGVRLFLLDSSWLPVSPQTVLKQARSLTISYDFQGKAKTLTINESADLDALFAVLKLRRGEFREEEGPWMGGFPRGNFPGGAAPAPTVTFHFPDGSRQTLTFERPNWLGTSEVDPRFYHALCQLASRAEGRPVELFPNERVRIWEGGVPGNPNGPGQPGGEGPQPGGMPADVNPPPGPPGGGAPGVPGQPGGGFENK
ncbi:MAG: hypothetical protein L0Z62_47855 [Gemmataceae bacterium]|nr:hypothetical protein [Gemmataceae bacterium]